MTSEERTHRALEITISEKVFSRLKTQMLAVYIVSFLLAATLASSLMWQYRSLSDLATTRISEYQLLVAKGLEELHRMDLEEVSNRTRPVHDCEKPLSDDDAEKLLKNELGRAPESGELRLLEDRAAGFGLCDIGEIEQVLRDEVNGARVDTVFRLLLGRPADPLGRFIYGYWLRKGLDVQAVGRDVMTSPEFMRLKSLSTSS
jgi:hypothetical protein